MPGLLTNNRAANNTSRSPCCPPQFARGRDRRGCPSGGSAPGSHPVVSRRNPARRPDRLDGRGGELPAHTLRILQKQPAPQLTSTCSLPRLNLETPTGEHHPPKSKSCRCRTNPAVQRTSDNRSMDMGRSFHFAIAAGRKAKKGQAPTFASCIITWRCYQP